VRDYEPHTALDGGPDGLGVVSKLIEQAPRHLKPGGHLIIEIGDAQEEPVRSLIDRQASLAMAATVYDLNKHPRVMRATRKR
jgi:release factor glutamine methyltransferase